MSKYAIFYREGAHQANWPGTRLFDSLREAVEWLIREHESGRISHEFAYMIAPVSVDMDKAAMINLKLPKNKNPVANESERG